MYDAGARSPVGSVSESRARVLGSMHTFMSPSTDSRRAVSVTGESMCMKYMY